MNLTPEWRRMCDENETLREANERISVLWIAETRENERMRDALERIAARRNKQDLWDR